MSADFGAGWWPAEPDWRWAQSPAELRLHATRPLQVSLELTPAALYDPAAPELLGAQGTLRVQIDDGAPLMVPATLEQPLAIRLSLPTGASRIRLSLAAGNFFPPGDERRLSFAVRAVNLRIEP